MLSSIVSSLIRPCSRYHRRNRQHGFTLFELIVVTSIIAIMTTIALPSFMTMMQKQEAQQTRYKIANSINIARAESLIKHQDIIFCIADSSFVCNKNANAYLLVFTDREGDHIYNDDANRLILKLPLALKHGKIHLRVGNRHYMKFFADTGLPRGHFGHIKYCPTMIDSEIKYRVSVNAQGIVRFKPNSDLPTDCP